MKYLTKLHLFLFQVTIDERYLHAVLGDLAQHRSDILEVTQRNELKVYFILILLCIILKHE